MAAFHSDTRPILGRGPSILLRFVFFALLSIGLMWIDQRQGWLESVRYGMAWAAYPFQVLVNSPGAAWDWLTESFSTRERLQRENAELRARLREADLRMLRYEALEQENIRLRAMREATANIAERAMVAEIMRVDLNPFRHRVILNKGARNGAFKGQPLLDAHGVFGQITRVGPFSSEAILISDSEHAIPVQVNRNGLRTIAIGTGDLQRLSLPFLPINADIRAGDLLVTSGLDEVFPAGYPVAVVTEVDKSPGQTLATISARPAAALDRDREVLLVWVKEEVEEPVEAPAETKQADDKRSAPQQPSATPQRPTATPQQPSAAPQRPSATQQQTGTTSQRPATTTQQPSTPPAQQSAARPQQPAGTQPQPTTPRQATETPQPPATEPTQPAAERPQPTETTTQPTEVPPETNEAALDATPPPDNTEVPPQ